MVRIISLAAILAVAATQVSAVDIKFRRYAQPGCNYDNNHIEADTHLHDPHCKTFSDKEPAFYSFEVIGEDDMEDLNEKLCKATVYHEEDCKGNGFTFGGKIHLPLTTSPHLTDLT